VLSLFPRPNDRATAFVAVENVEAAVRLLDIASRVSGGRVTALELLPETGLEFITRHSPLRRPLSSEAPWYVLVEISGFGEAGRLAEALEESLGEALEQGLVMDAVVARSQAQAQALWAIRETLPLVQKPEGGSIKHDLSLPVSKLAQFMSEAAGVVERLVPGARPVPFGHIGDGNIHFNASTADPAAAEAFQQQQEAVYAIVHRLVMDLGGSFSAEHGIGWVKVHEMSLYKSSVELALMQRIKRALDPAGLLNPGKNIPTLHRCAEFGRMVVRGGALPHPDLPRF
jgi:FAD/FMN-containing dehydrogenase